MSAIRRVGVEHAGQLRAGLRYAGSALKGPFALVGDGISRPRFLHRPQQYHPVHCRPALQHLYALADGPVVEQV